MNPRHARALASAIIGGLIFFAAAHAADARPSPTTGESLLWEFTGVHGRGADPYAPLIIDNSGRLYGTTSSGFGGGTVFRLTPKRSGEYALEVLHVFRESHDGSGPMAGLLADASGTLYGTTYSGGNTGSCGASVPGCGTVFALTPQTKGYGERILYAFSGGDDGMHPSAGLIEDSLGNLYGTTAYGGSGTSCTLGCGTVFTLTRHGSSYVKHTLYQFQGSTDGGNPVAPLLMDGYGNLYGTAYGGGNPTCLWGCGTVFKLTPHGKRYVETTLYEFTGGGDGANPMAPLIVDTAGNLYGTAEFGGNLNACHGTDLPGCGTVYELTPSSGTYVQSVIHAFGVDDGAYPIGGLLESNEDVLYGTTAGGGSYPGGGTVFSLTPQSGTYAESVLYSFEGQGGTTGGEPAAGLVAGADGALYGTTFYGGDLSEACNEMAGCGIVFRITP